MPTLPPCQAWEEPPAQLPCPIAVPESPSPPGRQMKWHEVCLSISAAILEILNAWENGVLTFESIQVGLVGGQSGTVLCPEAGPRLQKLWGTLFSCPDRSGSCLRACCDLGVGN